jgi:hypothetical protein
MIKGTILLFMIFLHIQDDFNQGIISQMKKKSWWKENVPSNQTCKYDYIIALILHGFKTTFVAMLPILIYALYMKSEWLFVNYLVHLVLISIAHSVIDNRKCNGNGDLVSDQLMHICMLLMAWVQVVIYYEKMRVGL